MGQLGRVVATMVLTGAVLSACGEPHGDRRSGTDWSPAARQVGGLRVLAESDADGFRLHTASGDKTFLPGVNLGSTTPLHQPGEVGDIPAEQFATWLQQMGETGIRVVRVYTLLPPGFYEQLAAYNRQHERDPIYLVQGAYLPDESYVEDGRTLYDAAVDDAFRQELRDISDAVHGALERPTSPGRAGGTWTTDVSEWVAGWIIGVEWDPAGVARTDELEDAAYQPGDYFVAQPGSTPTERWIALHMNALAGWEAARGSSAPLAMANWPTTDPLAHPEEPRDSEDLVAVDAKHVLPTEAWPGGTFASFHAYPYYPDFQRFEPDIQDEQWNGRGDPYAGYVAELRDHFAGTMPLLVTEFGVPSSLGTAHFGPLGRDQGAHREQDAMAMDADMMRMLEAKGTGGAFVFVWEDEWFKRTWNTLEHQDPERRQLWHDPLTNEQWFGLVATDPDPLVDAAVEVTPEGGPFEYIYIWADASWVHIEVTFRETVANRLDIAADVVPELAGPDYRVRLVPGSGAELEVRRELDPIRLDTDERPYREDQSEPWHLYALITKGSYGVDGAYQPKEYHPVGRLVDGTWDQGAASYDSTSTWQVDTARRTVQLRLPWPMLGLADPSGRTALGPGMPAELVPIDGIDLDFEAEGATEDVRFTWPEWNFTTYTARPKAGIEVVEKAFRDLAP